MLVKAYGDVKDNTDSGQFLAIQHAGRLLPSIIRKSRRRSPRNIRAAWTALVEVLRKAGFNARKPKGSFFLYVAAPKAAVTKDGGRIDFRNAEEVRNG